MLLLSLTASCGHSENRYLKRVVQPAELVGRYLGTPSGMEGLKYAGFRKHLEPSEHFLELFAEGRCEVQTVADPQTPGVDGGGKWIAAGTPCKWESLPTLPRQRVSISVSGDGGLSFFLDEEDGRLVLWQYAADPDAWRYMELKKVVASAG